MCVTDCVKDHIVNEVFCLSDTGPNASGGKTRGRDMFYSCFTFAAGNVSATAQSGAFETRRAIFPHRRKMTKHNTN